MKVWLPLVEFVRLIVLGNNEADSAAALGRGRVHHSVASAG